MPEDRGIVAAQHPVLRLCRDLANSASLEPMFAAVVAALVETTGFDRAAVLTFDAAGVMRFRAAHGLSAAYMAAVDGHSPWRHDETAARPLLIDDVTKTPALQHLATTLAAEQVQALAFLPIVGGGRLLGKFMLYAKQPLRWSEVNLDFPLAAADLLASFLLREEAQERLLRGRRMQSLGLLAGGVAHDFNNLLTTLVGYLDLLRQGTALDSPLRGYVEELVHTAACAGEITRQLLDFARPGQNRGDAVDLVAFLHELLPGLQRLCAERVTISLCTPAEALPVPVGRAQLHQLLLNLVTNARDAMPAGGCVTITAWAVTDDGIRLEVSDPGIGMDAATQARAFEPLFTTKGDRQGTGLGLAICYAVVAAAGGDIQLRSAPGRGTAVLVQLPRARPPALAATNAAPPRRRLLIVDDQEGVRNVLARALGGFGYVVTTAANSDEALRRLAAEPFDAVVTDVVMPGMNGFELARVITTRWPELPLLLITGFAGETHHAPPGVPLLLKPFLPRELDHRLRQLLPAG
ncbi:MAG: response regulator [Planctomycetes bacterium]|nr:response regulator [Planctomycetota bacterium]